MQEQGHAYTPARVEAEKTLPAEVMRYLDGSALLTKTQALRLSTIDAAGWPHASLLSAGDMVAVSPHCIRFVLFPQSTTVANLTRDGRVTMTLSLDGGMCEMRLRAHRLPRSPLDVPLAFFEAALETARHHIAPYAAVTAGITFTLHEPAAVLPRWQRQIAALRAESEPTGAMCLCLYQTENPHGTDQDDDRLLKRDIAA